MAEKKLLLEDIRVIDAASFIAGPAAATIMSDYGADVIKIEPPEVGDSLRWLISRGQMPEGPENYCWQLTSRNKRSIALNLKDTEAQDILIDLVKTADVFITNMPFPIREKLKIRAEDIRPHNDQLIYASMSGYGEVGPDANRTAYDSLAWWARSGLMDFVRPSSLSPPAWSTPGMGDHPTATALFGAIMTALYRREKTGKGTEVSTSLMANGAWANACFIQGALMEVEFSDRTNPPPRHPFGDIYSTKDNRQVALAILGRKEWPKLAKALGREDWLSDSRFEDGGLVKNQEDLRQEFSLEFANRDTEEINSLLKESGVTFGFIGKITDCKDDEQFLQTETIVPMDHEKMPGLFTIDSPIKIVDEPKKQPYRAPILGEHTQEILKEIGMKEDKINELKEKGTIEY
ncbi:MAG: CoA transferase [SAR86 cluster bacterium]|jgi:formyl-CoA transferase|nr:CoA transferase [SAR86 cluster bacterium]